MLLEKLDRANDLKKQIDHLKSHILHVNTVLDGYSLDLMRLNLNIAGVINGGFTFRIDDGLISLPALLADYKAGLLGKLEQLEHEFDNL